MLPKQHRLARSRDFARVRRLGRSAGSPLVAVSVLSTRTSEIPIGFSVSKRVGGAVTRNRVKRRMREAVRQHLPVLRRGQDLVFTARPAAAAASYDDLAGAIGYLLRKSSATESARSTRNA